MAEYSLNPVEVPQIETKYRSIKTAIPVPESLPFFERLRKFLSRQMPLTIALRMLILSSNNKSAAEVAAIQKK